jgi:3-hydroxybutyryl-CoA dehydrogenase
VALRTGVAHQVLVCIDLTGDTTKRVTAMTAPGADRQALAMVASSIIASGRAVTAINDSPGFVAQRISAMIANLGCYMAEIGLASPSDIDLAMQLGLNYPLGPLALAEDLGVGNALRILEQLQKITGEDRYRPTMWLKRRALLGLPIHMES